MRRLTLLLAACCVLSAAAEPLAPAEFKGSSGVWELVDGALRQSNPNLYGAVALRPGVVYRDVAIEASFRVERNRKGVMAAGLIVRALDPEHFLYAHFDSKNQQVLLVKWSAGSATVIGRFPRVPLALETWHTAKLSCRGTKLEVSCDGKVVGAIDNAPELSGMVGLRTGQAAVAYRDFSLTGTPEQARDTPPAWWNPEWRRRRLVTVTEQGLSDRDHCLVTINVPLAGLHPAPLGLELVVIDPQGRQVKASLLGVSDGQAELSFPVRVPWCNRAVYSIYYDHAPPTPANGVVSARGSSMKRIALGSKPDWQYVGGTWETVELPRCLPNQNRLVALESTHHVAFPGICKTKSGDLLVVYREGYSHASGNADDGRVMSIRSTDLGQTWSAPALVYDDPAYDDRNAAVSTMDDGTIVVIFDKYLHGTHHFIWMVTSDDEGRTWTDAWKVGTTEDVHSRSPVLDLGRNTWLVPYSESTHGPTTATFFSRYDPKTKQFVQITATPPGQRNIADEVCVARAPDGTLVALIRSNTDPALFSITSTDEGRTWSEARPTEIPSQFTPADLVRLSDGRLVASFSFRERRDERLVVSRDNGRTWDIERSVDVFVATQGFNDRSYPASVQLDEQTIGTVLYETRDKPDGGRLYFVTTPIAALDAPGERQLGQTDPSAETAFAVWPESLDGRTCEVTYRFTGRFGDPPNRIGLLLSYQDPQHYAAFEYQMGAAIDRRAFPTNAVHLAAVKDGQRHESDGHTAVGAQYDTGNEHRLGARLDGDRWVMTLDGRDQLSVPSTGLKPCGLVTTRATVAVVDVTTWDEAVQNLSDGLSVDVGDETKR